MTPEGNPPSEKSRENIWQSHKKFLSLYKQKIRNHGMDKFSDA